MVVVTFSTVKYERGGTTGKDKKAVKFTAAKVQVALSVKVLQIEDKQNRLIRKLEKFLFSSRMANEGKVSIKYPYADEIIFFNGSPETATQFRDAVNQATATMPKQEIKFENAKPQTSHHRSKLRPIDDTERPSLISHDKKLPQGQFHNDQSFRQFVGKTRPYTAPPSLLSRAEKASVGAVTLSTSLPATYGISQSINPQQRKVLELVMAGKTVFITGGAGVGKTFLLNEITRCLDSPSCAITASTGIAAMQISGMTLHRFAGIRNPEMSDAAVLQDILKHPSTLARWKAVKTIVIDEISMVDGVLFDKLEWLARHIRQSSLPFGGIRLILSGDFLQLPPVSVRKSQTRSSSDTAMEKSGNGSGISVKHVALKDISQEVFEQSVRRGPKANGTSKSTGSSIDAASFTSNTSSAGYSAAVAGGISSKTSPSKDEKKTTKFAFEGTSWSQCITHCVELIDVYRQKEEEFINMLNRIRLGTCEEADARCLFARKRGQTRRNHQTTNFKGVTTRLMSLRREVEEVNVKEQMNLPGEQFTYTATDSYTCKEEFGTFDMDHHTPVTKQLFLKVGSQVLLIKTTDANRGLVNGLRGVVGSIDDLTAEVKVHWSTGLSTIVDRERFTLRYGSKVVATRVQMPLVLAWAISIHKCQGLTLDSVEVHLGNIFEAGQAYVALSRAKTLNRLYITGATSWTDLQSKIRCDPRAHDFHLSIRENLTASAKT